MGVDPADPFAKDSLRSLRIQRRLRGAAEARVSAPPMAASLLAASRRTKASKPIRTREVFSVGFLRRFPTGS